MNDPNRTHMGTPPAVDPNRTILGQAPSLNATQTIKPVQCPVCRQFNPVGVRFCVECGLVLESALPNDAFAAPAVRLPVLVDEDGREHVIRPGLQVVGRAADLILDDSRVSRRHAQIVLEDDQVGIEDLGSTNGTRVDDQPLPPGERRFLAPGAEISLGGRRLRLTMPAENERTALGMGGRTQALESAPTRAERAAILLVGTDEHPLKPGDNTFGRRSENDVVISDPYVSGRHGRILVESDRIVLVDVGSTNGTYVNGARIQPEVPTEIGPDDVVTLGALELRIRRV
jgi:pSer/pThr/pTyr-binding forkhead associated (FHA) protein